MIHDRSLRTLMLAAGLFAVPAWLPAQGAPARDATAQFRAAVEKLKAADLTPAERARLTETLKALHEKLDAHKAEHKADDVAHEHAKRYLEQAAKASEQSKAATEEAMRVYGSAQKRHVDEKAHYEGALRAQSGAKEGQKAAEKANEYRKAVHAQEHGDLVNRLHQLHEAEGAAADAHVKAANEHLRVLNRTQDPERAGTAPRRAAAPSAGSAQAGQDPERAGPTAPRRAAAAPSGGQQGGQDPERAGPTAPRRAAAAPSGGQQGGQDPEVRALIAQVRRELAEVRQLIEQIRRRLDAPTPEARQPRTATPPASTPGTSRAAGRRGPGAPPVAEPPTPGTAPAPAQRPGARGRGRPVETQPSQPTEPAPARAPRTRVPTTEEPTPPAPPAPPTQPAPVRRRGGGDAGPAPGVNSWPQPVQPQAPQAPGFPTPAQNGADLFHYSWTQPGKAQWNFVPLKPVQFQWHTAPSPAPEAPADGIR